MGIENLTTKAELLAFIRQELQVPPNLQGALGAITKKLVNFAGIDFGDAVVTYSAATLTQGTQVNHGLGVVPSGVLLTVQSAASGATDNGPNDLTLDVYSKDATKFYIGTRRASGVALTSVVAVFWVAFA